MKNKATYVIYDVDRHEKIGEAYDEFMCQDMLYMFWDHEINNMQVQRIVTEGEVDA